MPDAWRRGRARYQLDDIIAFMTYTDVSIVDSNITSGSALCSKNHNKLVVLKRERHMTCTTFKRSAAKGQW